MKSVVITGASTGIGYAAAARLTAAGYTVFGSVRNEADANRLQRQLGAGFIPLIFDVTDDAGVKQAAALVRDRLQGQTLTALVNNAGIAVSGPVQCVPLERFRDQMEVNVLGLIRCTQEFLPLLGGTLPLSGTPGRVINISSVSGFLTTPFMGPYCMSKYAVESLSDALRRELVLYGIKVVVIQPGPIRTEIWQKALEDKTEFPGTIYDPYTRNREEIVTKRSAGALPVGRVAQLIQKAIEHSRPRPRYLIAPSRGLIILVRMLPARLADRLFRMMMRPVKQ